MQYCGVVGPMADTDGHYLAENLYKSLFLSRGRGVPYYERLARALREAEKKGRNHWRNVYFGA